MGPVLKGWSPPFTASGASSYWPVAGEGFPGVQPMHNGIFIRFEADAEALAKLLPAPLEASEHTGEVTLFINRTVLLPFGKTDMTDQEPGSTTQFGEALLVFPCRLGDKEMGFHYIMYTDSAWCVYCGAVAGLTTKGADMNLFAPLPAHQNWAVERPGSLFKATVAREGQNLMTANFTIGEEVDPTTLWGDVADIVGMRYFPDKANAVDNTALVHDLVLWDLVNVDPGRTYTGEVSLHFGDTATDELGVFEPKRIISAHYIEGMTYHNRGARVVHNYLESGAGDAN
jgi:acetoacetate decarboxylase